MDLENEIIGQGWSFPPSFSKHDHSVSMVNGIEDIKQSLDILFHTTPGERIMLEKYGCDLREFAFAPLDVSTLTRMKSKIQLAIVNYESRIVLESIEIDDSDYLNGFVSIVIDFKISQSNSRHNVVYPFYFLEGTNI